MDFNINSVFFAIIVLIPLIQNGTAIRTKDKMYENIETAKTCFRRLNATHQIGCSSERGGSTGAIHFCETQADLDFILKNGTAPPYVPILPTKLFTVDNLNKLKSNKKISGLVLYAAQESLTNWTHENQCPNPKSSLPGTCTPESIWNPLGTGILYQEIPFPMFYVENEGNVAFAKECFVKYNNHSFNTQRDRSLCSLELVSFMFATTNSSVCIRRSNTMTNMNPVKFCDPLGDRNVWGTLFPLVRAPNFTEPIKNFTYIIVAARLDTTSLFDKTAGAISPITGLVTLLATAKYLKTILPENKIYGKNVLYLIFNGESYDYIGSQRFVYELLKGEFPPKFKDNLPTITMDDIELYIELSQLGRKNHVVAHSTNYPRDFVVNLNKYKESLIFQEAEGPLPPSSLHTFLKNRTDLPNLILTDHEKSYFNPFYNSVYDNASNIDYTYLNLTEADINGGDNIQNHIQKVSSMLGKSLYQEITGQPFENFDNLKSSSDIQFIDELFHCYLENSQCRVHEAIQQLKLLKNQTFSLYVGVEASSNFITTLVGLTLGWITGNITGDGNINCTNEGNNYAVRYYNMSYSLDDLNTTKCFRISMNFTEAVSPAFVIEDYDWSSGEYSSWTESTWGEFKIRIFLKPSAAHENMTIAIGSMVFIFSLLFVYFIKSRAHVLFSPQVSTLAPTNC